MQSPAQMPRTLFEKYPHPRGKRLGMEVFFEAYAFSIIQRLSERLSEGASELGKKRREEDGEATEKAESSKR